MEKLRKVTFGELAEIADTSAETIRARIKRGDLHVQKSRGWARFDAIQVLYIASYCKAINLLGNSEMATQTASFIAESCLNFVSRPPFSLKRTGQIADAFLVFRFAEWDPVPGVDVPPVLQMKYYQGREALLDALEWYTDFSTASADSASFHVINTGPIADWILDRLFDLQGIDGDEALGAKK